MERINGFSIFQMAKTFAALGSFDGSVSPRDVIIPVFNAQAALRRLLNGDPVPLGTSKRRALDLVEQLDSIDDEYFKRKDENGALQFHYPGADDPSIPQYIWGLVKSKLSNFEIVLSDEMREMATYYVPRRGIYFTPSLVDDSDECFPDEIRGHIPEKASRDWKSAGRCLAFNLLTASGFHAARAVEGTLEFYYQLFCNKPGQTLRGWDDYIKALQKVIATGNDPMPLPKTLAELDQMRSFDRNPIMHPRIVLTESDAHSLFASSLSLIIAMAQEIKELKNAGGVQVGLAGLAQIGNTGP